MTSVPTPTPTPAHPLPSPDEKPRVVEEMFDRIAPRYDLLNRALTFGMDVSWRRRAVASLALPPGSRVLDVACGTGDLCRDLERAGLAAVGLDFSTGMLRAARTDAPLVRGDALRHAVRGRHLRRGHLRLRAAQLRRAGAGARRDGARAAPGRAVRPARGRGAEPAA
ncbi:MAG: hypothetical protein KatS3mg010_1076 [Acidimicrobiia bacterium]|nr:MAG: hypothetical protein KatS3mg010_1076 [Acidimicrobiia bacterium]